MKKTNKVVSVAIDGDPNYRYILGKTSIYSKYPGGRIAKKSAFKAMLVALFVNRQSSALLTYNFNIKGEEQHPITRTVTKLSDGGIVCGCHIFTPYAVRKMKAWVGLKTTRS